MKPVLVGSSAFGTDALAFIAGPCALESLEMGLDVAWALKEATAGQPAVFKASLDKANRTDARSYRGPGWDRALDWLLQIREQTGLPVTTDVHHPEQVAAVAEGVDLLQIPAFLCRQTDLVRAAADSGRPVNIKKGQFLSAAECGPLVQKAGGPGQVLLTERGTTFGYHDLVADLRNIPRMAAHGVPVVFDATHSVQRPGHGGTHSGGDREYAAPLARAAVAAGAHAIFCEVHPDPRNAKSDAATQLAIPEFQQLVRELQAIRTALNRCRQSPASPA